MSSEPVLSDAHKKYLDDITDEFAPPEIVFKFPLINRIKVFFGMEICPICGSRNVLQQGWTYRKHRHFCRDCGKLTGISGWY
jgi:transposase-like protein